MKKIFVLLSIFLSSLFAQSPVSTGTYTVGGNISFSSYSEENSSESNDILTIAPNLGYFFIDNFYTGMSILYRYQSVGDNSSSTYGFGPVLRYYFDIEKVKPFLGLEYVYSYNESGDNPIKNTESTFTLSGGVDLFITNYFALEGSINYSFINDSFENGNNTHDYNVRLLNIGIGAKYFIQ